MKIQSRVLRIGWMVLSMLAAGGLAAAAVPGDVTGLAFSDNTTLTWSATADADDYNVYRGVVSQLGGVPAKCLGDEIDTTSFPTATEPVAGTAFFYLVTGESDIDGEGPAGMETGGAPRDTLGTCDAVMRNHLLNRTGYGWSEWSRDRLASLGRDGYLNEQLAPSSIDESTNTELQTRLAGIEPPQIIQNLASIQLVRAVYGHRQLEQQTAMFFENHFNTDYQELFAFFNVYAADVDRRRLEATTLQYNEIETFRDLAFNGNFREMVEASVLGPAMLIYLDADTNVAGRPNENLSRETLELYTMDVDNGYTQTDVEELSRIYTGWNVCKKVPADVDDPARPLYLPRSARHPVRAAGSLGPKLPHRST